MRRLGLTDEELRAYHRTLITTHQRKIIVEVYDLDGKLLRSLTPVILDGQVVVDTTAGPDTPTRILDLTFLDPGRATHFEPASASDAPIHRSRVIKVTDSRRVPELDRWVDCEVFTGVVWDFDRNGAEVTLVAHGMERQALGNKWTPVTYRKGKKKTDVLKLLLTAAGESYLGGIPDLPAKMPERMTIARMDQIWPRCVRLAKSMDRQLFYTGAGRPVLRRIPSRPLFTFTNRHLLSEVQIDRDAEGVYNTFLAVGAKPKGGKNRPRAVETFDPSHPLSPQSLARDGKPLRLVRREEIRQVKTVAEAKARAKRMRDNALQVQLAYSFDVLPIPHLDELDMVTVRTDEGTHKVRMQSWTLPLRGDEAMAVGSVRRLTKARRRKKGGMEWQNR